MKPATKLKNDTAIFHYEKALNKTRNTYLELVKITHDEAEKDNIWAASFTLQYMIASHQKYLLLLRQLSCGDEKAHHLLEQLFDQVNVDPETSLQGFIDGLQALMRSAEFKSELADLNGSYKSRQSGLFKIRFASAIILCITAVCLSLTVFNSAFLVACVLAYTVIFDRPSTGITKILLEGANELFYGCYQKHISAFHKALAEDESQESYTAKENDSSSLVYIEETPHLKQSITTTITYSKTHEPRLKTDLRNRFFQAPIASRESLEQEVQTEFLSLINEQSQVSASI